MWVAYSLMLGFVVVLAAIGLYLLKRGVGLRS
jgi:ABC-2 type transport system permease protein